MLIVTLISNATNLVVAIGCCCLPAYLTFVALESEDSRGLQKYLIYWIIYAIFEVISPLFFLLISSTLYVLLRIAIAVALLHPESSLGNKIYDDFISPFFSKYEENIDENI